MMITQDNDDDEKNATAQLHILSWPNHSRRQKRMAPKQNMTQAITQAATDATKAEIMAVRESGHVCY